MASESLAAAAQFFGTAHGAFTLLVALGTAALGLIAAAFKFRHEQFRKLPLEHLKMLQEASAGDPLMSRCISQATHLEVARQTFGMALNPAAAGYLFALMDRRHFSLNTLRAAAPYVETDGGVPEIRPGVIARLILLSAGTLLVLTLWVTGWLMVAAFQMKSLTGALSMLGVEVVGLLLAGLIGRFGASEMRAIHCAREAAKLSLGETPALESFLTQPTPPLPAGTTALSEQTVACPAPASETRSVTPVA